MLSDRAPIQPAEQPKRIPWRHPERGAGASTPPGGERSNVAGANRRPREDGLSGFAKRRSVGRIVRSRPCAHFRRPGWTPRPKPQGAPTGASPAANPWLDPAVLAAAQSGRPR